MTRCANCDGSGLAGAGPEPWKHQGAVSTCSGCKGTGSIGEAPQPATTEPEGKLNIETPPGVDPTQPEEKPGFLGKIKNAILG